MASMEGFIVSLVLSLFISPDLTRIALVNKCVNQIRGYVDRESEE